MIEIIHSTDDSGTETVTVPLTNSERKAVLYADDFKTVLQLGISPKWRYQQGQVFCSRSLSLARLVADAGLGEQVQYLDNDMMNLRRDNLALCAGTGKFRTRDQIRPKGKLQRIEMKHIYEKQDQKAETAMID